jgi:hypothetical protein
MDSPIGENGVRKNESAALMRLGVAAPSDRTDCAAVPERWGMFDWVLGAAEEGWPPCGRAGQQLCGLWNRKYRRDFVGTGPLLATPAPEPFPLNGGVHGLAKWFTMG